MLYILLIGILMAIASACFWCLEAMPVVREIRKLDKPDGVISGFKYVLGFLAASIGFWKLAVDLYCTIWLVGSFGFTGMIGGVIGLTVSNVISLFLMFGGKFLDKKEAANA